MQASSIRRESKAYVHHAVNTKAMIFIATVNDRTFEKAHASSEWVASDFTAELMNHPFISSWSQY
ncbi:hypothetical protein AC579_3592 [Pseudocercospora musae]|uniref:Uncharacterized protein n=1 Tax=Pseudocercospora musae TaxID=113226 RepID=A0A139GU06_9PEZI|nr:hypothetical protein AC579_3592 [Pseudocercospora musae]